LNFFDNLIKLYSDIKFPEEYEELSKIDKHINWYLADNTNQYITATKSNNIHILELDIKNAFTTICNAWFDKESDFIQKLNKLQDKKAKNIFIATSLKNTEYLKRLNMICKMIIMGIIFKIGKAQILELKKDGAVIICDSEFADQIKHIENINDEFIQFIISNQFIIKINEYESYIRSNKTSYFWDKNELITKGTYKYIPIKLLEIQKKILLHDKIDQKRLLKIYSRPYFEIIRLNNLNEILENYYKCSNNKYLNSNGKYITKLKDTIIEPRLYLQIFIFPIILSTKI